MSMSENFGVEFPVLLPLEVVSLTVLAITWLAVLPRFYTRFWLVRNWGWEDVSMIPTMGTFTALTVSLYSLSHAVCTVYLQGTLADLASAIFWLKMVALFYFLTCISLKVSLAFYFVRLGLVRWQRWVVFVGVMVYWLFALPTMMLNLSECGPLRSGIDVWIVNYVHHKCTPWSILGPLNYLTAAINCTMDFMFVLMPVCMIYRSKLEKRQKLSATALVALGLLGSCASLVRLAYVEGLQVEKHLFPVAAIGHASVFEVSLGIIAASLVTLKPLFGSFFGGGKRPGALPVKEHTDAVPPCEQKATATVTDTVHAMPGVGFLSECISRFSRLTNDERTSASRV